MLARWFPAAAVAAPKALHLDVILYSRKQIVEENVAMGRSLEEASYDLQVPWGIVSIKPQHEKWETPMQPMTVMRNALGKEHGGSGVPLDREKYMESVAFWSTHAIIQ